MSETEGGSLARCPWCSAELPAVLPADAATTCPSCGAALTSATGTEPDIRGVTTLDHEALLRARSETSRPRGRLFSFITGDTTTAAPLKPEELASLAPPDSAVRREMMRLELEAQRAELEAESLALRTDAVMEQGLDLVPDEEGVEAAANGSEPSTDAETANDADEDRGTVRNVAGAEERTETTPGASAAGDAAAGDASEDATQSTS